MARGRGMKGFSGNVITSPLVLWIHASSSK